MIAEGGLCGEWPLTLTEVRGPLYTYTSTVANSLCSSVLNMNETFLHKLKAKFQNAIYMYMDTMYAVLCGWTLYKL